MTLSELFGGEELSAEERQFLEHAARLWAQKHQEIIRESEKADK